jgi:hypothetical protein
MEEISTQSYRRFSESPCNSVTQSYPWIKTSAAPEFKIPRRRFLCSHRKFPVCIDEAKSQEFKWEKNEILFRDVTQKSFWKFAPTHLILWWHVVNGLIEKLNKHDYRCKDSWTWRSSVEAKAFSSRGLQDQAKAQWNLMKAMLSTLPLRRTEFLPLLTRSFRTLSRYIKWSNLKAEVGVPWRYIEIVLRTWTTLSPGTCLHFKSISQLPGI